MMTITIFTAVFILLFPTLGSAMTGYTPNNDAFVKAYDGTLIPIDSFELIGYVIHDAWRINLTGDYALTFPAEGPGEYARAPLGVNPSMFFWTQLTVRSLNPE